MATCKLNAEQFTHLSTDFAGVMLVYRTTNRDGLTSETAQYFWGEDYEVGKICADPVEMENEIFRVWKNVVTTFWAVKQKEMELRQDNDGIRSKLRASTPSEIIIHASNGLRVKRYELEESVWQKIGLIPTKKDLERTARDFKKAIHAATKASFDALGFRVDLQLWDAPTQPNTPTEVIELPAAPAIEVAEVVEVVDVIDEIAEVVTEEVAEEIAEVVETPPAPQKRRGRRTKNCGDVYAA